MPPTITRLLSGRQDNDATSSVREVYRITDAGVGITIPAAREAFNTGGYGPGHAHPDVLGLVARLPTFDQDNATVLATVDYVIPALATSQPPIDPTSPNFSSISCDYRRTEMPLPSYRRKTTKYKLQAGVYVVKEIWEPEPNPRSFSVSNFVWTYRLSGEFAAQFSLAQWLSVWSGVNAHADELHLFNGVYFRFEPKRISQETASTSAGAGRGVIEYNWVFDPGVTYRDQLLLSEGATGPGGVGNNTNLRTFYQAGSAGRSGYIPVEDPGNQVHLYPWREVSVNAHPLGPEYPPITVFQDRFKKVDNGWTGLPGVL